SLRMVYEGYVGFDLSAKGNKVWLDMGVFSSHIGFESAIGGDCATLSRSIMADNSPYYESGLRLGKAFNDHWTGTFFVLNGWQRMTRGNPQYLPSAGYQVQYLIKRFIFNSSAYIGNEAFSSIKMRYFHNFWMNYTSQKGATFTLGFDDGWQEKFTYQQSFSYWGGAILVLTYPVKQRLKLTARGCYFTDKESVIIPTQSVITDVSLGADYVPFDNAKIRVEGRWLNSNQKQFRDFNSNPTYDNFCVSLAFTYSFEQMLGGFGQKYLPIKQ
ncbi:MAG: outer membrane beta-barrel protein, partial [Bacteroidia bacterium]